MLSLCHINLPAREPEQLAQWYADQLGFERAGAFVGGPRAMIAFEPGEPLRAKDNTHFGFAVASEAEVRDWAERLGLADRLLIEPGHASVKGRDPEGNVFEIYWDEVPMFKAAKGGAA